jgi:hypothetical protein
MTDFFDDLEQELRRAHRRDTARHARSRVFVRRRLSGLRATGRRTLVALAVVVALVAVVLAVARESEVERPVAPQPSPTPGAQGGCLPGKRGWEAPIVDEPIPREIASRFALFRDGRPSGKLPRDRHFPGAKKLYGGALTLGRRLDTGARFRLVMIAADITTAQGDLGRFRCSPPPDPTVPGLCVAAFGLGDAGRWCFSIEEIENADAWFDLTRQTVVGLAPDGVDRVTFDTPAGTQSLNISSNVFAGEVRSAHIPSDTNTRFAP